jgi:hypothetical protein
MENIDNLLCSRCSGKGFMDWVEKSLKLGLRQCSQKELDYTYNKMLLSYVIFYDYDGDHTLFYRERNLKNDYIKDCEICSECEGVGLEYEYLKNYIPDPFITFIKPVVYQYIKSEQKIIENK